MTVAPIFWVVITKCSGPKRLKTIQVRTFWNAQRPFQARLLVPGSCWESWTLLGYGSIIPISASVIRCHSHLVSSSLSLLEKPDTIKKIRTSVNDVEVVSVLVWPHLNCVCNDPTDKRHHIWEFGEGHLKGILLKLLQPPSNSWYMAMVRTRPVCGHASECHVDDSNTWDESKN